MMSDWGSKMVLGQHFCTWCSMLWLVKAPAIHWSDCLIDPGVLLLIVPYLLQYRFHVYEWGTRLLLRISWCTPNAHHWENNLAKFGYVLDTKVEKKELFYILGYLLELIIKICWFGKNSWTSPQFRSSFPWKSFLKFDIIFFRLKFGKN
jgi:hypothetical protein